MDTPSVELEFPFTFADRLKAGLAVTVACGGCLLWVSVFPVVGVALPLISFLTSRHVAAADWALSAFLILFMPLMILWGTWKAHKAFADTPLHKYTFNDKGVRSRSTHTEIMQDWPVIKSVSSRHGFLMLFFTKRCAHCIPLRFLSGDQIELIGQFARSAKVQRVDV